MNPTVRQAVIVLALSAAGFVAVIGSEGYIDTAIQPLPGDVPTLGFGTTDGVKPGDRITPPKAVERALSDVQKFEGAIKQCVKVPLHQHEYDAYVAVAYNVGAKAFCSSTLVRLLNAGQYAEACAQIKRWVYFKGQVVQGLVNRREREYRQCMGQS
jgi:lysozyme